MVDGVNFFRHVMDEVIYFRHVMDEVIYFLHAMDEVIYFSSWLVFVDSMRAFVKKAQFTESPVHLNNKA